MTIAELKEKLNKFNNTEKVIIEGCDCEAEAVDVKVINGQVMITREDGKYSSWA
jgi:hypothetical protein